MAVLALLASGPQSGTIRGTASVAGTGELLPGVEVTATSEGVRQTVHTDEDGHFSLSKLPGGTYELSAELPGFCAPIRTEVKVSVTGTIVVDFSMELRGMLSGILWVMPEGGLGEAYRSADAVVHLQITRSMETQPWGRGDTLCGGVVGTEHIATVLDALKVDSAHGAQHGSELRFVQYPAGTWTDGTIHAEGIEDPYSPGEEYVAFLKWDSRFERFARYVGPIFMFPVRDGQVFWKRDNLPDVPGLQGGMTVESFFAVLRALPGEVEDLSSKEKLPPTCACS